MLAEGRFTAPVSQLGKKRLNLAKGCERFAVRREERVSVDRAGSDERGGHVPVSEHHAERCVPLSADRSDDLADALRFEAPQKPLACFAQHRLAPEPKAPQLQ